MNRPLPVDRLFLKAHPLPKLDVEGGKDERGTVLVVAGSREVPGAVLLAAEATLRVGAGKLQIATVGSIATPVAIAIPEARVIALPETTTGEIDPASLHLLTTNLGQAAAVVVGPGMMDEDAARPLVAGILDATTVPVLLDAAAMTAMRDAASTFAEHRGRVAITPHPGEMATFLGIDREVVLSDPLRAGMHAAEIVNGIVAMKGSSTFVCAPGGGSWSCEGGGIGMATSGSGDVLAGVIGGLLARGASPLRAVQWGVFLHAEAGRRLAGKVGTVGYLARELVGLLPGILDQLSEPPESHAAK